MMNNVLRYVIGVAGGVIMTLVGGAIVVFAKPNETMDAMGEVLGKRVHTENEEVSVETTEDSAE